MRALNGKTALVTGAGRGIGRAVAERLGREGARVGVHFAQDERSAREVVATIAASGGEAFSVRADFTDPGAAERVRDGLAEHTDQLDILVNNAGVGDVRKPIAELQRADLERLFAINVMTPFLVTQALTPLLRDGGRVINVSSNLTRSSVESDLAAYAMSKAPLEPFTIALAKTLGPRGITVNTVAPGVVDTDMNAEWLGHEQAREFVAALAPLGRVAQSDDVAGIISLLVSDDSGWLTGQRIEAAGGAGL